MSPLNPFPVGTVGVVLVENVVSTIPKERSIDVVHPSPRRREMIRWSLGISLKLLPQFLCTLDELFGLFNFVGHDVFTPFVRNVDLHFLQTTTDSPIHTPHADVRRVVLAAEGCIDQEYRGTDCN